MGECASSAKRWRSGGRLYVVFADRPGRLGFALREEHGKVDPVGLYDLDRNIRPVGKAYKQLIYGLARSAADTKRLSSSTDRNA